MSTTKRKATTVEIQEGAPYRSSTLFLHLDPTHADKKSRLCICQDCTIKGIAIVKDQVPALIAALNLFWLQNALEE